jgi:hypothetical protein
MKRGDESLRTKEEMWTKEKDEWMTKHGHGHCITLQAWMQEVHCDEGVQMTSETTTTVKADTQTDNVTTNHVNTQTTHAIPTTVDTSTQVDHGTDKMAVQTNDNPNRRCAILQAELPNEEDSTSLENT